MTQITFDKSTKFFRSFTASTMPVVPVDEVDLNDIDQLVSFYAADFDDKGRLARFRKFLNEENDERSDLNLVFDDQYTYSTRGNLELRTLIRADGNEDRWIFDTSNEADLWRDVSLAQDQLTELENRILSDFWETDLQGDEFTVLTVRDYLISAELVLRTAIQDPNARILMLIPSSGDEWLQLHPPDVFETSLSDLASDLAIVLKPEMLVNELPLIYPNAISIFESDRVFGNHKISAVAACPVRVKDDKKTVIGVISMLGSYDLPPASSQQVLSLLKRITVFVELLIELGNRESPIQRSSDASKRLSD